MSRGYSQSQSEGFAKAGSPADLRNRALDAQAAKAGQRQVDSARVAVQGILGNLKTSIKGEEIAELVKYTAQASEKAADHLENHTESVRAAKALMDSKKKGTWPYEDFDELTRGIGVNLLTPDEMKEADEDEDIAGDYAEKMSQILDYEYEDEVMSDSRGNYLRTNYDNDDKNERNESKNKAGFAKAFIQGRLEAAENAGKELQANLDKVRTNAVQRWLNQREKGNI